MTTPIFSYALDKTGVNPNNLVKGEIHATENRTIRAVALSYGAFYGNSLVVVDNATGATLTSDQFYPAQLYTQPTLDYGQPIYSLFMITDATVSDSITVQYQALGGPFSTSQEAIVDYINNLDLDSRPASWPNVINKPDAYTPSPHLHTAGDLYGFEYVVQSLDRLAYAIQVGDAAYNDAILAYVDSQKSALADVISALQAQVTAHIQDTTNPHKTTAAQVGAYTTAQTDSAINTVNTTLTAAINAVSADLTTHVNDVANPHEVTAAQVGAYTTTQVDTAINNLNTTLTTAINQVQANLTDHENDTTNPHNTTAAQVGTYTSAQIDSLIANASGDLTSEINDLSSQLQAHEADTSNPHKVTAAQLGVYTTSQSDANLNSAVSTLNASIATKAPANAAYAYQNQTNTFADIHATGTIYSANDVWAFNSDERLKCDFELLDDGHLVDAFNGMNGYTHRYPSEMAAMLGLDPCKQYVGLKAQEVQRFFPQIVGPAPFDRDPETGLSISGHDYLTVQYDRLVPVLLMGIKYLMRRVDTLEQDLNTLDKEL